METLWLWPWKSYWGALQINSIRIQTSTPSVTDWRWNGSECVCACVYVWTRFLLICLPKALTTISSKLWMLRNFSSSFFFCTLSRMRLTQQSWLWCYMYMIPFWFSFKGKKTEFKIYYLVHDLESLDAWSTCCKLWVCMFLFAYQCVSYWSRSILCVCHISRKWGCPASDTDEDVDLSWQF